MDRRESLRQQIEKAEVVLAESQENFNKNPEDYSARLLLMSIENHLSDLLRKLETETSASKDQE